MKTKLSITICLALLLICCGKTNQKQAMTQWTDPLGPLVKPEDGVLTLGSGSMLFYRGGPEEGFTNFTLTGQVKTTKYGSAGILFHTDLAGIGGYEVLIRNGEADGSCKTGSLSAVRNLYKSVVKDEEWFPISISVRGKNISVAVNHAEVVCYTEPQAPHRTEVHKKQLLSSGDFVLAGYSGQVQFKDLELLPLPADAKNTNDSIAPVDEQNDAIIRLQQQNFPVIDYHVHLKGWSKEQAQAKAMNYGINYGIAPNCGIGFPITDDAGVSGYRDSTQYMPFFFGMQGEGREWVTTFSEESRNRFDYVFTDALTFTDHKNRRTRLWIDDEVFIDIPQEEYMDLIVDRIVKVLHEEPIDIYVNPCMLPTVMNSDYDKLWTPERIDKVVQALQKRDITLEINARYRIPNFAIIRAAKDAGIRFSFGTNNGTPDMGKLEYCIEAIDSCGLTVDDMWFPAKKRLKPAN